MGMADKFWAWLGIEKEEVREEIYELPQDQPHSFEDVRSNTNVVAIHSNKTMKVVVCEPTNFEEVQSLADHLKNRKQVILNMEMTPPEVSQRIIDFISGTTYSLEGHSQQLGKNIFIFTPSNVEISKDHSAMTRRPNWYSPLGGDR
ncbi:MAG: cell division protein SepF [Syntrophomonadaceae bacterium]|nr:cell division protein SepF [Syntrophomonadaceae bacterium]